MKRVSPPTGWAVDVVNGAERMSLKMGRHTGPDLMEELLSRLYAVCPDKADATELFAWFEYMAREATAEAIERMLRDRGGH